MNKREAQRELRRYRIMEVGLDLFIRNGFAATKIGDIAAGADMSMGLLFHYFESKEKLYETLVELGASGHRTVLEMTGEHDDPIDMFAAVLDQVFYYLETMPFVAKLFVLMRQVMYSDAVSARIKEIVRNLDYIEVSVPLIEKGQQMGSIRAGDPRALAQFFWMTIQVAAENYALTDDIPLPEQAWIVDSLRGRN